jgi:septal ring factor EnvC (AmiA/AmiB activator)
MVQEDLQQQLGAMRRELSELEQDLTSRDREAAELSRALAEARAKLGNPASPPHSNGSAHGPVPGSIRVKFGARVILCPAVQGVTLQGSNQSHS